MKKLFVLAVLLTAGAYSASAQTTQTTTTKRSTTMTPSTTDPAMTPSSTTSSETTTTTTDQAYPNGVPARTKNGRAVIVPEGAKVKGNGKRIKIK